MGVASRLRRHPYALGLIALLVVMVGGGILALSGPWRSTAGAQGGVPAPPRVSVMAAAARTRDVSVYLNGLHRAGALRGWPGRAAGGCRR